jgi:hypothetical protein
MTPEAPELTPRLQQRAVVGLTALDALPTLCAVDARRLKCELGKATDLAVITGVKGQLRRHFCLLRNRDNRIKVCPNL